LRPIVDYTVSICYYTKDLVTTLTDLTVDDDEVLISYDVVSLFTNTPNDKAVEVIKQKVEADQAWKQVTLLESEDVVELLEFTLSTTYFCFRGELYKQSFGTAMGSPVSPLVADNFMEHLEQTAIATAPPKCKPKLWKRYVDDIFAVVKRDAVSDLTDHLNQVDDTGSIKFKSELEKDNALPFLDMQIVRKPDGNVKQLVYRKQTHTDQYLHFSSHHSVQHKLSVIRTLLDRCNNIVTEEEDRQKEELHIRAALSACGYPEWSMKLAKEQLHSTTNKKAKKSEEHKFSTQIVIPYVKGLSESLSRTFSRMVLGQLCNHSELFGMNWSTQRTR